MNNEEEKNIYIYVALEYKSHQPARVPSSSCQWEKNIVLQLEQGWLSVLLWLQVFVLTKQQHT